MKPAEPFCTQAVDEMVARGIEVAKARTFCLDKMRAGLKVLHYTKVFRGNDVVAGFMLESQS